MNLTFSEWSLLNHMLEQPKMIAAAMPLESFELVDALCEDLRESWEYNHENDLERMIIEACITESDVHEQLPQLDIDYGDVISLVNVAYSLQDRFAVRFQVEPAKWIELSGKEHRKGVMH